MKKYNIGDKVWVVNNTCRELYIKCPDCLGQGALTVLFPGGDTYSIKCSLCGPGYNPSTGSIKKYQRQTLQNFSLSIDA